MPNKANPYLASNDPFSNWYYHNIQHAYHMKSGTYFRAGTTMHAYVQHTEQVCGTCVCYKNINMYVSYVQLLF